MQMYTKIGRDETESLGAKMVTTKRLDVNTKDAEHVGYRTRLVGREIKKNAKPKLFATTFPSETLKVVLNICAQNQKQHETLPYIEFG